MPLLAPPDEVCQVRHWHYPNDSATKLRNECLRFRHVVFLFKVRTINAFVNTMGRRQMKNSRCFKPACGGKSSTFWKWHCLRKIALESKRLIHTWWTWWTMAFNQECCWNYGSKSLHSFWATLHSFTNDKKGLGKENSIRISPPYFWGDI